VVTTGANEKTKKREGKRETLVREEETNVKDWKK